MERDKNPHEFIQKFVEGANDYVFANNGVIRDELGNPTFEPLCIHCRKSKMTCENFLVRSVRIPIPPEEEPEIDTWDLRKSTSTRPGFKLVDGVKEGIYKSEREIKKEPLICGWFEPMK